MTKKKYATRWVFIMPRWRFIFLTIAGIWFLSTLGFWQLNRVDEKRTMLMHYAQWHKNPPIVLNDMDKTSESIQGIENYQPIQAIGAYDNAHIFFLDNQFHQHQLGYEVIEPFILSKTKKTLLVSLGWVKASENRRQLPIFTPITGEQNLHGMAYFPSKSLLLLGSNSDNDEINAQHWPKRIEKWDQQDIQKWLKQPIYPFVLRLDSSNAGHFIRDWPIVALPPERHIGYAIQWFAMAVVVFILFLVVNIKKRDNKKGDKK